MTGPDTKAWWTQPVAWVELFVLSNLAFLAVDIGIAHAVNAFGHPAEWIPVGFSLAVTPILALAQYAGGLIPRTEVGGTSGERWGRRVGFAVGCGSMLVGISGFLWHLNGDFFRDQTLHNLVYTAPFVAPLAYTGLGLVLILNRMVVAETLDWSRWIAVLAGGGFVGNFVLSLADHAQNGFFSSSEWTGVIAGAVAVGFLTAIVVVPGDRLLLGLTALVLLGQVGVGVLGFALHVRSDLSAADPSLRARLLYGAPVFAPLLFADLALLAALGVWAQTRGVRSPAVVEA